MKETTKVFMQALLDGEKLEYRNTANLWAVPNEQLGALQRHEEGMLVLRVAPKTIFIGDKKLPSPRVEAPKYGESYWFITLGHSSLVGTSRWENHLYDESHLQSGNVFKTREDAKAVAEQLVSLLTQNHPKTESTQ